MGITYTLLTMLQGSDTCKVSTYKHVYKIAIQKIDTEVGIHTQNMRYEYILKYMMGIHRHTCTDTRFKYILRPIHK